MRLVERQHITHTHPQYEYCKNITHLSKNLYNAALYLNRQHYFKTHSYYSDISIINEFTQNDNVDYRALPSKVAKQTVRQVHKDFTSFFKLLELKRKGEYDKKVNIPGYKDKKGYTLVTFPKESISKKPVYDAENDQYKHTVCGRDKEFKFSFYSQHKHVDSVRIIPKQDGLYFILEIVYTVETPQYVPDNGKYASIDLGVNNLLAVFFNFDTDALLINGRPVKSVNQYYNKKKAQLQKELFACHNTIVNSDEYGNDCYEQQYNSNQLRCLSTYRSNKINDALHKVSRFLVNHVVSLGVSKVIVGKNDCWKQDIKMGKRNNQTFVQIPHAKLINMLKYKLDLVGIELIIVEESYTSKCSALDYEEVTKHDKYAGKRVKRGLFKTRNGILINADINGAINIMRKVFPNEVVYFDGIVDVAVRPKLCNVLVN